MPEFSFVIIKTYEVSPKQTIDTIGQKINYHKLLFVIIMNNRYLSAMPGFHYNWHCIYFSKKKAVTIWLL